MVYIYWRSTVDCLTIYSQQINPGGHDILVQVRRQTDNPSYRTINWTVGQVLSLLTKSPRGRGVESHDRQIFTHRTKSNTKVMGLETQAIGAPEKKKIINKINFIGKISVMHDIRNAHVRHESKISLERGTVVREIQSASR